MSLGRLPAPRAQRRAIGELKAGYGQLLGLYAAVARGAIGGEPARWAASIGQREGLVNASARAAGVPGCAFIVTG